MYSQNRSYLFWGTITALVGVGAVRLIAPEMIGILNKIVLISGYLLSLTGIIIIARAVKD